MTKKLLIFGQTELAELAHFYFSQSDEYQVVGFTIDASHMKEQQFQGLPVIAFEDVAKHFPPENHHQYIALGYTGLNEVRKTRYLKAKSLGYRMASHVHPHASVARNVAVGDNTLILENAVIQPFVQLGRNLVIWSGALIAHHTRVGDHCFIAPRAAIAGNVRIGEQCFIGINATLRDGIHIGDRCVIGAGALLLNDAASDGVYRGSEAPRASRNSSQIRAI